MTQPPEYPGQQPQDPGQGGQQPPSYPGGSESTPPSYPPPPPGGYPPAAPGGYGQQPQSNKKALWSMILGIVGLLCCGVLGVVALILGVIAKREINESNGTQTGGGQATAGIVLGVISIAFLVLNVVLLATGVMDLDFYTDFSTS